MAAFYESYSRVYELRSLALDALMVTLTAAAAKLTKDTIFSLLNMENAVEIRESPNKLNVACVVQYFDMNTEQEFYFGWLTDEMKQNQEKTVTIIYCQTVRQCGILYATFKALLGKYMFLGDDSKTVLVEMLHSRRVYFRNFWVAMCRWDPGTLSLPELVQLNFETLH